VRILITPAYTTMLPHGATKKSASWAKGATRAILRRRLCGRFPNRVPAYLEPPCYEADLDDPRYEGETLRYESRYCSADERDQWDEHDA
jgi:hypothetical protein